MGAGGPGSKPERSILSFFDRSTSAPSSIKQIATSPSEEYHDDNHASFSASPTKVGFKQSCLSFDVLDPSKAGSYISSMAAASKDDDRRVGGFMKELPKLTGRAPYEDLMTGMIMRSSKLPSLNKLNLHHAELDMDMLANVKMVHEFLNTFGTPLGLTKDSGEWITFDLLLSMIRNPRIDDRLLDLNCKMIMAAYEEGQTPKINRFNFPYFLAVGPESLEEQKEAKKNKHSAVSRKKTTPLGRLGTIEYSVYTIADRIEALVKALHDITSSDRFHRFMRDEVEENITTLKRQKRKRAEVRKELETQTHDLESEMKAIEREAAELEIKRQTILTSERENGLAEDDAGTARITAASRLQRLAQAKDARSKANELLSQQKSLANDLKAKESAWESKKEELEDISLDDSEVQKDHNVPLTQLRGGQVVNTDDKLRVICLGSDRWGRKYWLWKEFGGVIIEDRAQVGPKTETLALAPKDDTGTKQNEPRQDVDTSMEDESAAIKDENVVSPAEDLVNDVTQRMRTMAEPELAGDKFRAIRDNRMSINNLLSEQSPTEEKSLTPPQQQPVEVAPEKDLLDYGQIQTWSLVSTAKELASITRALNGKGARERILKASLQTMRKEIEASFDQIKTWAGHEHACKNDQVVSVMGAVGQPLSETDLMLLKKKRGRKSRQELADIAATQKELAAAEVDKSMDVDRANSEDPSSANLDIDMEEDGSDHEQLQNTEDGDEVMQADKDDITEGFLAAIRDPDSGPLPSEYLRSIVQAAEEKLKELSRSICGGDSDAISTAIQELQDVDEGRSDDRLPATVRALDYCLTAMDESLQDAEDQETQDDSKAYEPSDSATGDKEQQGDLVMDSTDTGASEVTTNRLSLSIPVSVDPRLLTWLRTCRIDSMLKNVKTFGTLHVWLDECIAAVESVVYEADDDDGEDEEMDGVRKKKQEGGEADEDENEEHEGEDEDEDENDHEEDEGEDAHDEKAQEDDQEDDGEEDEEEEHHGRQRKARHESRLRVTTIRGRALRARSNRPVSYKYEFKEADEGEEEVDDEDEDGVDGEEEKEKEDEVEDEVEGIATRLRRSKRTKH
ncbi:hypothetical protein EDD21DRAFT_373768 [Dissophora ornata]|nr:hypothetical protein EDD21DRAFT_373768 [Dissophora ornata]